MWLPASLCPFVGSLINELWVQRTSYKVQLVAKARRFARRFLVDNHGFQRGFNIEDVVFPLSLSGFV